ncbi:MAG: glycosyltransferase [Candidatus Woesebacteria bacterium]|jgi:glycosyltransferase involved in cell wall biosynthesis
MPLISIIISTKNEEKNIANCLKSIQQQSYPQNKIEVIVVDNFSTDKTRQIAKKHAAQVYQKGPERAAQRNFGIKKAKGKYILFLDADMILSPKLMAKAAKKMETQKNKKNSKQLIALYINEKIKGSSFFNKIRNFERSFYTATVVDCVRFIKRSAFVKAGGFDERLTGPEDWDLDKRIRDSGRVALLKAKDAVIHHDETELSLSQYLKKKKYYSQSFTHYIKKWGKNDPDLKKQLGFYYRYFGVFTENGKWRDLVQHPILSLGMFFVKILLGLNLISVLQRDLLQSILER